MHSIFVLFFFSRFLGQMEIALLYITRCHVPQPICCLKWVGNPDCIIVICQMASMLTNTVCSIFSHQICVVGGRIYYRLTFREMLGGRRRSGFHHCVGQQSGLHLHLHLHLQSCHYNNHIFTHISSPSTNNSATPFKCYVVLSKYLSDQSPTL